jgi:hypothetical protein
VLPELAVLGGDYGVDQMRRDAIQPDHDTVLPEELVDDLPVAIVHRRADRRFDRFKEGRSRQVPGQAQDGAHQYQRDGYEHDSECQ